MTRTSQRLAAFGRKLREPVDGAWLGALRIGYGLALAFSMWRFLHYGWIDDFFVRPKLFFKYWGFSWVEPLSASGMHALFWALLGLSLCVAAGVLFRISSLLFAIGLIYVQLIDVSTYLNHYYLAALLALLLAASPAGKLWSVDAWVGAKVRARAPNPAVVATLWLYLFRFQVGVVYFFAGMAKAQPDWLLHAQPLRIWLGASTELPLIGPLFTLPWVPLVLSWCGFLFDTSIVFFLLHRRTRPFAYAVVLVFHALTRVLFPIGMFPVIMSLAALVFFSPSWPRRWLGLPAVVISDDGRSSRGLWRAGVLLAGTYALLQLALPLRFLAYGGNVLWHEQGMRFSWRVMVRAKGGGTTFIVHSPAKNRTFYVNPREYLTKLQESEMSSQPDLILQLSHHIARDFERRGFGEVEVRVESHVGLNGRRSAALIDPNVDLSRVDDGLSRAAFISPAPRGAPPHTRPSL